MRSGKKRKYNKIKRNERKLKEPKSKTIAQIRVTQNTPCCAAEYCLLQFDEKALQEEYLNFQALNQHSQRDFVLNYLWQHVDKENNKTTFYVFGKEVCRKSWLRVYGIGKDRFNDIRQKFMKGAKTLPHGNKEQEKEVNLSRRYN